MLQCRIKAVKQNTRLAFHAIQVTAAKGNKDLPAPELGLHQAWLNKRPPHEGIESCVQVPALTRLRFREVQ